MWGRKGAGTVRFRAGVRPFAAVGAFVGFQVVAGRERLSTAVLLAPVENERGLANEKRNDEGKTAEGGVVELKWEEFYAYGGRSYTPVAL